MMRPPLICDQMRNSEIVENFQLQESENFEISESEDTLSILDRYVDESEISMDKSSIKGLMRTIYQEACELV